MQPKKQLKFQYIGIFEEIDSFYWPKMDFLRKGQKIRAGVDPSLPYSGNARKKKFLSIDVFPYTTIDFLANMTKSTFCLFEILGLSLAEIRRKSSSCYITKSSEAV